MAKQRHTARRDRSDCLTADPPLQTLAAALPDLTDARWRQIAPLLPPEAETGRPPRDHRIVLTGMLWVIRTGAGWHDLPDAFGPTTTVQRQYRRWRADGTWTAMLAVLLAPDRPPDS